MPLQVEGYGQYDYPECFSIRDILELACTRYGDETAYLFKDKPRGTDMERSWSQLRKEIFALGNACLLRGASLKEERVAVIGENSYPWVLAHNAAVLGLGISVPLDHQLPDAEALPLLKRGKVSILAFSASHLSLAEVAVKRHPELKLLIALGDAMVDDPRCIPLAQLLEEGKAAMKAGEKRMQEAKIDPQETASLCFTSGTTSSSKGVLLSHRNIASNACAGARTILIHPQDRCLSVLPLHHSFENTVGMYAFWVMGLCICINDGLRYIGPNLKDWKIGVMMAVPLLIEKIYEQIWRGIKKKGVEGKVKMALKLSNALRRFGIDVRAKLFGELREQIGANFHMAVIGAAPLNPEVAAFFDAIGIHCLPGYGLTETSPILSCNRQDRLKPASAGWAIAGVTLKIDPESGEILAKGENVMQGYLDDPVLTAETIDADGFLHTGDIGYLDEDGALFITGRKKSMIVLDNGKKAFPEEIELHLDQVEGVEKSFVFQSVNKRGNTIIAAKIKVDEEGPLANLDQEALAKHLSEAIEQVNDKMPAYKAIAAFITTRKPFLMTTTLKIKRAAEAATLEAYCQSHQCSIQDLNGQSLD